MISLRGVRNGTFAGFAGTLVMTITLRLERVLRAKAPGPVDYDASSHVVTAAANALHLSPRTGAQKQAIFMTVHWGYGSVVGVLYEQIHARVRDERRAALIFFLLCQTQAFTLFTLYGETPPPWRWRRDMLASSLVQHAIYAAVVAAAGGRIDAVERRRAGSSRCV